MDNENNKFDSAEVTVRLLGAYVVFAGINILAWYIYFLNVDSDELKWIGWGYMTLFILWIYAPLNTLLCAVFYWTKLNIWLIRKFKNIIYESILYVVLTFVTCELDINITNGIVILLNIPPYIIIVPLYLFLGWQKKRKTLDMTR